MPDHDTLIVPEPFASTISFNVAGGEVFAIHADGRIVRGKGFTTDDVASLAFWTMLADAFPGFRANVIRALWQPIDTAPHDPMRCILVTWNGQTEAAAWNDDVDNWQEWPDGDFAIPGEVTHWMALPRPALLGVKGQNLNG